MYSISIVNFYNEFKLIFLKSQYFYFLIIFLKKTKINALSGLSIIMLLILINF